MENKHIPETAIMVGLVQVGLDDGAGDTPTATAIDESPTAAMLAAARILLGAGLGDCE